MLSPWLLFAAVKWWSHPSKTRRIDCVVCQGERRCFNALDTRRLQAINPALDESLKEVLSNGWLLALASNIRLEWKWMAAVNTLACYNMAPITVVNFYIVQSPDV